MSNHAFKLNEVPTGTVMKLSDITDKATIPNRRCFDVTMRGYNASTDATDHLVKWIVAPSLEVLNQWLDEMGLTENIHEPPRDMGDFAASYEFSNGVDVVLSVEGERIVARSEKTGNYIVDWLIESYIVTNNIRHPDDYCSDHGGEYNPVTCNARTPECPECKRNRWLTSD